MIGALVPLVLMPRFTSYLGAGTHTTVPLDVADCAGATVEFWRGKLRSAATGSFDAHFEVAAEPWADDGLWTVLESFSSADASDLVELDLSTGGYLRVRIVLADDTNHAVGITCCAAGSLQRRVPRESPG